MGCKQQHGCFVQPDRPRLAVSCRWLKHVAATTHYVVDFTRAGASRSLSTKTSWLGHSTPKSRAVIRSNDFAPDDGASVSLVHAMTQVETEPRSRIETPKPVHTRAVIIGTGFSG